MWSDGESVGNYSKLHEATDSSSLATTLHAGLVWSKRPQVCELSPGKRTARVYAPSGRNRSKTFTDHGRSRPPAYGQEDQSDVDVQPTYGKRTESEPVQQETSGSQWGTDDEHGRIYANGRLATKLIQSV